MERQIPFMGMAKEVHRLSLAFGTGDPLLLLGPQGSGKTRLIGEALSHNRHVLYIAWEQSLHALLAAMARALIAARHADFMGRAKPGADPESWLAVQTSIHLKGLLWTAMESSPVPMVLDGIAGASFPAYRFLQRISHTPGMALFASSRDAFSLGALARLFWNPAKTLTLRALPERDAERLFEAAAAHFRLRNLDLDAFREKVLDSARGNPGQILEMCRLATQPRYRAGRSIKFGPLRIDTVMKFTP
ncbi:MAG: hypothetical protein ACLQVN_10270 [Bryobacteraceae bacterium]